MRSRLIRFALAPVLLLLAFAPAASADTIRVQSTTDTVDAGLVDGLLIPAYKAAHPEDTLAYTGVGTGQALDNARAGLADVVITHAPSLERQFTADGFSLEGAGRAIFYSDYVIVGPKDDPANVAGRAPHDAAGAYDAISDAGTAGTINFLARGKNSGTDVENEVIWGLSSSVKHKSIDSGSDGTRFEPGPGPAPALPGWYKRTGAGQAANLNQANACPTATFTTGKCYTIVDRGTYNRAVNSGTVTNLKIVSQNNDAGARGGKDLLINPFSAYIVNPSKVAGVNVAAAQRFVNFLTSPGFQNAVDSFPTAADPAFRQDAFPSVTSRTVLPRTAAPGKKVSLSFLMLNRLPGAPTINGMPVQLQQSTDGGKTFANIGGVKGVGNGVVSFLPKIPAKVSKNTQTVTYRVSLTRFQATSWSAFSPSTQVVGAVSVPGDRRAARISRTAFTRTGLTFTVSEASKIKVSVKKRIVRKTRRGKKTRTKVTYRQIKTASLRAKKAGKVKRRYKRALAAGTYHVSLRVTDSAGNVKRATKTVKVKAKKHSKR